MKSFSGKKNRTLKKRVLTKGAMGLKALGKVVFDDFAAYAVELSVDRPFATYTFGAPCVTGLESNWDVVDDGSWLITEGTLHKNSNTALPDT